MKKEQEQEFEDLIILDETPHTDNWVLWQIEDRLAQRRSPIFCAPSMGIAQKQFQEVKEQQKSKKGELFLYIVGAHHKGQLITIGETHE